jgi:hypothetical protein
MHFRCSVAAAGGSKANRRRVSHAAAIAGTKISADQ